MKRIIASLIKYQCDTVMFLLDNFISTREEDRSNGHLTVVNDFNARRLDNIYLINHATERMLMKRPRLNILPR